MQPNQSRQNQAHAQYLRGQISRAEYEQRLNAVARDEELEELAADIVRYCPTLTHLLRAIRGNRKPVGGLN